MLLVWRKNLTQLNMNSSSQHQKDLALVNSSYSGITLYGLIAKVLLLIATVFHSQVTLKPIETLDKVTPLPPFCLCIEILFIYLPKSDATRIFDDLTQKI